MRFLNSLAPALVLLAAGAANAASWGFDDAKVVVAAKKGDAGVTETLSEKSPLPRPVSLGHAGSLKVSLTAKEGGKAKRPHQAFVILSEVDSGLEAPFPLTIKESGKGIVEIAQKDLPVQLLRSQKPLSASIVIGSFGSASGLSSKLFDVEVKLDPNSAYPTAEPPLRYGKLPEIHHIFRGPEKSPRSIAVLAFVVAVGAAVPALFVAWLSLGANLADAPKALAAAPLSHAAFFGSIVAMEGVFFLYYTRWNLFTVLPVIGLVGTVTFLSGSKALGEVQTRRLAGQR